ncbi:Hypothetical predicted protein [Octopus vulgaris]|uniref:Uncharacterized protein n=1 Tax=Octopus vulgaris TaxID=6645 RepID=A0AA36AQV6_OCTVU|nr:Hypothetical predicted protein [Octopus vulgaris]
MDKVRSDLSLKKSGHEGFYDAALFAVYGDAVNHNDDRDYAEKEIMMPWILLLGRIRFIFKIMMFVKESGE